MEQVILVDEADNVVGTMEKLEAHQKGVLHRAFSILLSNSKGEWLLQKRSWKKYHSAGLWTNTCCSHPRPTETMEEAMGRKLEQEMGIRAELHFAYKFIYNTPLDGLTEHELDHVYIGVCDLEPKINADEVDDWRYVSPADVEKEIHENPDEFTHWFKLIVAGGLLRAK